MADHGEVEYALATGNDYEAHEQAYRSFVKLARGIVITAVIVLILMAFFLA